MDSGHPNVSADAAGLSAADVSLQALRAFKAGNLAEGGALYRRALGMPGGWNLPVRRHAELLSGSGFEDAAEILRRAGLHAGADLSSGILARHGDPREAIAEYEQLFARGVGNARMMADYLVALSRAGESVKLAEACDPAVLFRKMTLPIEGAAEPFLRRVEQALLGAESRAFETSKKSIRNLSRVPKTDKLDHPDLRALHAVVRRSIADYMTDVRASGHRLAAWLRTEFDLHSWAVIAEQDAGHNAPHIHTGCWVIAVAYIAGEDPTPGESDGTLRVGPALEGDASCPGWPDLTIAPVPGSLVIMPAFYTHWTEPLRRPGLRISVAFNADDGDRG